MNKNSIIGLLLIFAIMIGYTVMMSPSKEELEARKRTQDSIAAVQRTLTDSIRIQQVQREELKNSVAEMPSPAKVFDSGALVAATNAVYGPFAVSASGVDKDFIIETDLLKLTLSNKGGRISKVELKEYKTFNGKPAILFVPDSSMFEFAFFTDVRPITTGNLYFLPSWTDQRFEGQDELRVSGNDSLHFAMRLFAGSSDSIALPDSYIEYLYTVKGNNYMVDFEVNFVNMEGVIAPNTKELNVNWNARLLRQEKNLDRKSVV